MHQTLLANARLALEPFLRGGWQAIGWVLGELIIAVSGVTAPLMIVSTFGAIGPWDSSSLQLLVGIALCGRGLASIFSGSQVMMISRKIARGQLDHQLIQPMPLWKSLASEGFSPFDLAVTFLLGVAVLANAAVNLDVPLSLTWTGALAANVIASALVFIEMQYLWGALAFWVPQGAEEITMTTAAVAGQVAAYPLGGVTAPVLAAFVTVVPVGFMGWFPATALLFGPWWAVWVSPLFAILFGVVTIHVFKRGLKRYAQLGIARYSDFGHRR